MAIVYVENFEWALQADLWQRGTEVGGANLGSIATYPTAMFGRCLQLGSLGSEFTYLYDGWLPQAYSSGLFSYAFAATSSTGAYNTTDFRILTLRSGTSSQLYLRRNGTGHIAILRGDTVIATSTNPVLTTLNKRYRIEIGFTVHPSAGSLRVDVDGATVLSATGLNTDNGAGSIDNFRFSNLRWNGIGTDVSTYHDDILFDTDPLAFRGDWTGMSLYPSNDVSGVSTPLSGTRWSNLDGSPASSGTYTTFTSTGSDLYDLTDLTVDPASIHAVAVLARGRKTHVGAASLRTRIKSGASYADGATVAMNYTPQILADVFMTDPATGDAWTKTAVDGLQIELERVS